MLALDAAWLQLQFEPTLSIFGNFWPIHAIFCEPFFHQLTKNPDSPPFCYPSLAHHLPYNASMRILAAEAVHDWTGLFLSHLIINFLLFESNPGIKGHWKVPIFTVLATCLVPSSVHVKPILKPNKVIQVRDFVHILMKHILAQPDSLGDKINNPPANQGWWARERTRTWPFRYN